MFEPNFTGYRDENGRELQTDSHGHRDYEVESDSYLRTTHYTESATLQEFDETPEE
jgi:hypothetical protein